MTPEERQHHSLITAALVCFAAPRGGRIVARHGAAQNTVPSSTQPALCIPAASLLLVMKR